MTEKCPWKKKKRRKKKKTWHGLLFAITHLGAWTYLDLVNRSIFLNGDLYLAVWNCKIEWQGKRTGFIYYPSAKFCSHAVSVVFFSICCTKASIKPFVFQIIRIISLPDLCLTLHLLFGWSGAMAAQLELWGGCRG